ncbi:gamma-aminobutyric acid type B receptor subunit 2-like isoform X2 [Ornithodoros turicata]|uniref:gamma-aminobutyric acid type B receptor subunit 2-like isoform X2 n=1 Tax=Ornithodoros turicata TaxID=34597 RepID=UPI00313A48C9
MRGWVAAAALVVLLVAATGDQPEELHIAGFFPTTANLSEGAIGRGVVPAVQLALRHINSSPRFLSGYHLAIYWNDTQCDPAVGMKAFFDMMHKTPKKLVLFGAACNAVTDPIAKASQFFQLVQLTYADTHPMYTLENYPNFFRVVPSESVFNPGRLALLKYFNWKRVGTLYQTSPRYSLPHTALLTMLESANITILKFQGIGEGGDIKEELDKLQAKDVRIILGYFDEYWARRVFCQAYKMGMYGRKYQWIIVAMYQERWWEVPQPDVTCDPAQITEAVEGYIGMDLLPLSTNENITVSGLTPMEYEAEYNMLRTTEYSRFHGYAYDGIWALALTIHAVIVRLRANDTRIAEFRYRNHTWGRLFKEALNDTNFVGVTGPVRFFRNERKGQVLLKQFQHGQEVKIGEYDSLTDNLDLGKGQPIIWRGGSDPPMDQTHIVIQGTRVNLTIYASLCVFCILGIILATVFLVINIKFRNQRYIKMSSPYLNNLIIVGCILTYTSVILLGMDSGFTSVANFPYICAARAWVLMSGFTLAFGAMFSKTWRVHAIFTNIKLNKKVIKDYKLFMVVGVFLMLDVIILTTWQIVDPFYRKAQRGQPVASHGNEDVAVIHEMEFCQSHRMTIFLGSIYAYKGLLMAFGCFLAWETRHVSIPALNDSKYVGMSVYNVVIMCTIGAAISFVLRDQQDAAFIIISVFIIFCSTTTLCLVFVPKVRLLVELRRNPQAGEHRVRATLKPLKKSRRDSDDESLFTRIKMLQDENMRYRQRLEEKNIELQSLLLKLKDVEPVIVVTHDAITTIPEVSSPSQQETSEKENSKEDTTSIMSLRSATEEDNLFEKSVKRKLSTASLQGSLAAPAPGSATLGGTGATSASTTRQRRSGSMQLRPMALARLSSPPSDRHPATVTTTATVLVSGRSPGSPLSPLYPGVGDEEQGRGSLLEGGAVGGMAPYARAIRRTLVNGLSSSVYQEQADSRRTSCHMATDEAESDSLRGDLRSAGVRRRAKSLGALRGPADDRSSSEEGRQQTAAVAIIERGDVPETSALPLPFLPLFSRLVQDRTALYSSYPSIKCDIVEYL